MRVGARKRHSFGKGAGVPNLSGVPILRPDPGSDAHHHDA
jgi:hypothetical protein